MVTAQANKIRGVDGIAGLAVEGWLKRSVRDDARLSQEHVESMRRQKIGGDKALPQGLFVDLLDNRQLRKFRNTLSSNTEATGAGLVPSGTFISSWEMALDSLPLRRLVTVDRVPRGGEHFYPVTDDRTTGVGYLLNENAAEATEVDCVFSRQILKPWKISSGRVLVSSEFTEDGERAAEQLGSLLGRRTARYQNAVATNGTGVGQPLGLTVSSTKFSASSATAIAGDDLLNLMFSASDSVFDDPDEPVWMMSKTVLKTIRQLKDGQGRYLFDSDRKTLLGYPVAINSAMSSTIASLSVSVLFGQFKRVRFLEVGDLRLDAFHETYAQNDQILFRSILRFDSVMLDPGDHPVVGLLH